MRFLASETQCTENEDRIISGYVGGHFRGSAQALGAGVGLAKHAAGRAKSFRTKGGSPWHGFPS